MGTIRAAMYGSTGAAEMIYGGAATIAGEKPWKGPDKDDTFRGGAIDNIRSFVSNVRAGTLVNNAEECVRSNLTCILGRMAAYSGKVVTWDEMMRSGEKLDAKLGAMA
jgi:hypothetical protein